MYKPLKKDEILKEANKTDYVFDKHDAGYGIAKKAMDIWAKEVGIEFSEWCGENSIGYEEGVWFYKEKETNYRYNYSTEQMFNLYLTQSKP